MDDQPGSPRLEPWSQARRLKLTAPSVNGQKLAIKGLSSHRFPMGLPEQPVTLSVKQIEDLSQLLSALRHDINGDLALVVAAAELLKMNPDLKERMLITLLEQPPKIRERTDKFSAELEKLLGITKE
jgi:hypothetical protein